MCQKNKTESILAGGGGEGFLTRRPLCEAWETAAQVKGREPLQRFSPRPCHSVVERAAGKERTDAQGNSLSKEWIESECLLIHGGLELLAADK